MLLMAFYCSRLKAVKEVLDTSTSGSELSEVFVVLRNTCYCC